MQEKNLSATASVHLNDQFIKRESFGRDVSLLGFVQLVEKEWAMPGPKNATWIVHRGSSPWAAALRKTSDAEPTWQRAADHASQEILAILPPHTNSTWKR